MLQGALNPIEGIGPEQLRVRELLERIESEGVTRGHPLHQPQSRGRGDRDVSRTAAQADGSDRHPDRERSPRRRRPRVRRRADSRPRHSRAGARWTPERATGTRWAEARGCGRGAGFGHDEGMPTSASAPVRHLFILRHGKAASDAPWGGSDRERPLTARGRRDATALGGRLAADVPFAELEGVRPPDLAICSAAVRTRQTADLVIGAMGGRVPLDSYRSLYEADLDVVFRYLREIDEGVKSALLVGHNPTMFRLALDLVDHDDGGGISPDRATLEAHGFPTCALAVVRLAVDAWEDVGGGCGSLLGLTGRPTDPVATGRCARGAERARACRGSECAEGQSVPRVRVCGGPRRLPGLRRHRGSPRPCHHHGASARRARSARASCPTCRPDARARWPRRSR